MLRFLIVDDAGCKKELDRFIEHTSLPDATLWEEAQTKEGLIEALNKIKKEEIVVTHLKNRHVKGFAVPIYAHTQVVASLSVFVPEYRCSATRQKEIVQALKESAGVISGKLSA